jgi:pSer/pThr/pTyr-binding forkhead associated (FHA) protein
MPELVFFRRGQEVLRFGLARERLVLGRGQDSDVVIPDPQVSRQHVALRLEGPRCLLEDLSGHGTLVAGQPMRHGELADGADLKLGQWVAVFRQRGTAGAESPTRPGPRTQVHRVLPGSVRELT